MKIDSTTPPETLVSKAQSLALQSDLVGLANLIKQAQKADVDPRIIEMMGDYLEVAMR
jgi:hypothetical protein